MVTPERIEVDPRILAGKPVIKGTRVPVHVVLAMLAAGHTADEVLTEYPQLERADVDAAIRYASELLASSDWVSYGVV